MEYDRPNRLLSADAMGTVMCIKKGVCIHAWKGFSIRWHDCLSVAFALCLVSEAPDSVSACVRCPLACQIIKNGRRPVKTQVSHESSPIGLTEYCVMCSNQSRFHASLIETETYILIQTIYLRKLWFFSRQAKPRLNHVKP